MKHIIITTLFLLITLGTTMCFAAEETKNVSLTNLNPVDFIAKCNESFKREDGTPFFPKPDIVPQSTETTDKDAKNSDKSYAIFMQFDKMRGLVLMQADSSDNKMKSFSVTGPNDASGANMATFFTAQFLQVLGLTNEELDNIFNSASTDNTHSTWSSANNYRVHVTVEINPSPDSNSFTMSVTATAK